MNTITSIFTNVESIKNLQTQHHSKYITYSFVAEDSEKDKEEDLRDDEMKEQDGSIEMKT
jgi:hypothetical protein